MSLVTVFAGTPAFSVGTLAALVDSPHSVAGVLTQPDRKAGRGRKLRYSAVKEFALQRQLNLYQPETLKSPESQAWLKALAPDVMVVIAYGLILPSQVLAIPRLGCINVHASLLPRWRGAAPIQRALIAGDRQTGVTIMQMDEGLDTGDILAQASCSIEATDTAGTLHDRLAALGATLLLQALQRLEQGELKAEPQQEAQACYADKITKAEAEIDWHDSAEQIDRQVRAFNPVPVAWTRYQDKVIRIWQSRPVAHDYPVAPGTIVRADKKGLIVAAGRHGLQIERLQMQGRKAVDAAAFTNAYPIANQRFGT